MIYSNPKKIINKFNSLEIKKDWSFKNSPTSALTHSYHRYPAKFIPNIVEKLLNDFTKKGNLVLDPFGGCGTTLVESKRMGRKSICFDINPVAKFIAEVKVTPINPKKLEIEFEKLNNRLSKRKRIFSSYHDNNTRIQYWFEKTTINELNFLYSEINKVKEKDVRKFFLCAFSHNLKNSSRWLMKSIKPTIDKEKITTSPLKNFLKHTKSMIRKNHQFYFKLKEDGNLKTSAKVLLRDSTKRFTLKNNQVDLIITSPPYVTSYEYADLHQLSLLWFGNNKKDFKGWQHHSRNFADFRKNFIGTSYKKIQKGEMGSKIGQSITENLYNRDKSLSEDVSNYFIDMNFVFKEMYRVLKKGKRACVVIGNTELIGVAILNAEVAVEQMFRAGFKNPMFIKREITSKMITPWRDTNTGKFTGKDNPNKKVAYQFEYVLIMEK